MKTKHLLIAVTIFISEILVATVFSKVEFIRSYASDFLMVMLIYHLVEAFRNVPPFPLAVGVFAFACGVEVSQYFHLSARLGFGEESLAGILLGSSFSWIDILAYFLGSLTSYVLDAYFLDGRSTQIRVERRRGIVKR